MKKILLFIVALVATLSINAQTTEIHNKTGKVASYLGADVNVKFGMDGSDPTIMVYKGDVWQKTYKGSEYKVVSTPVEETFKAVYDTNGSANTLTFYYDANDHSGDSITVYEDGTTNYLFDNSKSNGAKWGYNGKRGEIKSVVIDASVAGYKGLTSTAFMFQGMATATNISGAEYLDVSNVTDMSHMFNNFGGGSKNSHTTLNSVPDVSKWNTANVTNMTGMFNSYGSFSDNLAIVPDVSNWNTGKVTDMSWMFQKYGHESQNFNAVPDVSKWDTGKAEDMHQMFQEYGYKSTALGIVPDVSKWNTAKVGNMNSMFECFADSSTVLDVVPDVSKWNTVKVTDMGDMFNDYGHKSTVLDTVPDVSKWKTDSVETMANMFKNYGYSSTALSTVPNVSNWNTGNVTKMTNMFQSYGYSSTALSTVPDVSQWDTRNMKDISDMFQNYGYSSTALSTVPDVSNWKTGKMKEISNMFENYGNTSQSINCTLDLSGWDLSKITNALSVFKFNPSTFNVTIPAKTGDKANDVGNWYFGDGTDSITPPEGKSFTMFGTGSAAVKAGAGITGNKVKWVQLWEGGPKFAEYNVGVTDGKAESYGGYYTWGGFKNKDSKAAYNSGTDALTGSDDTATNLWGDNWRMPTQEELKALIDNCKCTWIEDYNGTRVKGLLCKGKENTDYASNSVFLPAAGFWKDGSVSSQGIYGDYWSSTPDDEFPTYARDLYFESDIPKLHGDPRYRSFSVRAVVRDPVAVTGVSLNKTTLELGVGASETLTPTFIPADADNKNVSWTSDNESVATVDANGKVTAVAIGEATITVTTEDGNKTATCKLAVFPAGSVGTIKAKIGEKDVDVKWVQLWAGGPKFAEYNVGATDGKAESYGGYYCWGKATDKDSQGAYKDGTSALTGTDDTATNLWGSNWRMPTKDEFDALLDNCTCTWIEDYNGTGVNGWLCKGKENTDYASNSVFLPAAGCYINGGVLDQGGYGGYWSSTPDGSDDAYFLYFDSGTQFVNLSYRSFGFSVRAVVNDTGTAKATIGGVEKEVKWIQLWEGGPKFAEYNVGATSATEYGEYYAWGGSQNKVDDHNTGSSALSGDSDTATKLWGSKWRMPTQTELKGLIDNCDVAWTTVGGKKGCKFTGKGAYSSNSVFLPAAGYCNDGSVLGQGDFGYYWSSTPPIGGNSAYCLPFYSDYQGVGSGNRVYGYSVRAVLAKE